MSSRRPIVAALLLAVVALAAVADAPALAAENGTWGITKYPPARGGVNDAATPDGHQGLAAIPLRPAPGSLLATRGAGRLDLGLEAAGRGEPLAFGFGTRQARAQSLLDEAAVASGYSGAADLVDEVIYSTTARSPSFWVTP